MNDWIEWSGGRCPVDGHVRVDVKLQSGEISLDEAARGYSWNKYHNDGDIIAYRLAAPVTDVPPAPPHDMVNAPPHYNHGGIE